MRVICEIDIFSDEGFRRDIARLSAAVLLVGGICIIVALSISFAFSSISLARLLEGLLISCLAALVALPIHELVHDAAFKLLGGREHHVTFGFKDAFLYTRFQGPPLTKARFIAVLLAPSIVLSVALPLLCSALGWPLTGWVACVLHLSGCAGDLLMAREILVTPGVTHVEDTDSGCRLLG